MDGLRGEIQCECGNHNNTTAAGTTTSTNDYIVHISQRRQEKENGKHFLYCILYHGKQSLDQHGRRTMEVVGSWRTCVIAVKLQFCKLKNRSLIVYEEGK